MKPSQTVGLGALAAICATTAETEAATVVQITLIGNKISSSGDNLKQDITGDGIGDLLFTSKRSLPDSAGVKINGGYMVFASFNLWTSNTAYPYPFRQYRARARFAAGGVGVGYNYQRDSTTQATYLNPITFIDSRINGGAATNGYLEVHAFNTSDSFQTVELTRLVFDNATTDRPSEVSTATQYTEWSPVPELSNGLMGLALGAAGVLRRRRDRKAS